jgi:hypothetical protein
MLGLPILGADDAQGAGLRTPGRLRGQRGVPARASQRRGRLARDRTKSLALSGIMAPSFASHILIVVLCVGGAAGYPPSEVLDLVGFGWLNSFFVAFQHA